MNVEIRDSVDEDSWNAFVASLPEGCFYQTTYFATIQKKHNNQQPHFVTVHENGALIAQLLLFTGTPIFLQNERRLFYRLARGIARYHLRTGTWAHGPLIADRARYELILDRILERVRETIRPRRGFDAVTPPVYAFLDGSIDRERVRHVFERHGFHTTPAATILARTDKSLSELWDVLKKEDRAAVERARKQGITINEVQSEEELRRFYTVYEQTRQRNRITSFASYAWFTLVWNDPRLRAVHRFFYTVHESAVVSCQIVSVFNGILYQSGISISDYALANKLYGNDLLQWHLIEWASGHGYRIDDLVGYTREPVDGKEQSINHFKERWGTDIVDYDTFATTRHKKKRQKKAQAAVTLRQRIESQQDIPFRSVIVNQYSYLDRQYHFSSKISFEELSALVTKARDAGVQSHQALALIEHYMRENDVKAAIAAALPAANVEERIAAIVAEHRDLIRLEGVRAKGKLMNILRREFGDGLDGKIAARVIDGAIAAEESSQR